MKCTEECWTIEDCFPSRFAVMENINKVRPVHYSAVYGYETCFSANKENMLCKDVQPNRKDKLSPGAGAHVCGQRESTDPFIKEGQNTDIRNTDSGTVCGQAYKNISSYSTKGGYGICFDDAVAVSFEVARGNVSRVQCSVPDESLEYYILFGPTTKKILERYTALIGRPALPPKGTFGLWLPASFPVSHDEYTVTQFIDGMSERCIPLSVFHFGYVRQKKFLRNNYPSREKVSSETAYPFMHLHGKRYVLCVWSNPYSGRCA